MAEEIIGLKVELDTSGASAPMASLKSQIKEATNELVNFTGKFGATSKEAINAAKRVAELKDRMGDARQMVDAFNPDAKFNALTQAISGAANAFSAVQGAMGLFGVESANTEKALLKVQSAMAFSQGLSSFLDGGIEGFKNLYRQISGPVISAFTALKTAIGSTGIGLLVIAIAAIAANWGKITTAISGVSAEQRKLNELGKKHLDTEMEKLKHLNSQDNVLKLQGKSEREILNMKISQYETTIKDTKAQIAREIALNNAAVEAAIRNKEILISILDIVQFPIIKLLEGIDAIGSAFGKQFDLAKGFKNLAANIFFDPEQLRAEATAREKALRETLDNLTNEQAGLKLSVIGIDKKAADKKQGKTDIEILKEKYASELLAAQEFHLTSIEKEEDYEKKKLAITEKYLKTKLATNDQTHVDLLNAQREINDKLRELNKEVEEEAPEKDPKVVKAKEVVQLLLDTEGNYIQEKDDLYYKERQKSILSASKQLEIIRDLRIRTFDNEVLKIRQEHNIKFEIIKGNKAAEIALEEETAAKIAALRQSVINQNIDAYMEAASSINGILSQSNANQLADLEANSQARIAAAGGNKEAILAIENETAIEKNRLQNEQVKRDKLFAIAEAIINTYKAAAQVFARPAPGDPVTSLGIKIASMVAAVASGIANVMAIRKVPLPSGGGGGGGDVSGGSAPNSPMGTVFNTITKLNKDSIDKINDKAVKAYVVETDINNGQKRIERILINTKFK